jgi:hypothetical protein
MNVEIGAEAALFPEKEYINSIFFAVWDDFLDSSMPSNFSPNIDVNTLLYFYRRWYGMVQKAISRYSPFKMILPLRRWC